jgi:hypothetical protein
MIKPDDDRDRVDAMDLMEELHDEIVRHHHRRPNVVLRALGALVYEIACWTNERTGMTEECPRRNVEEALEIVAEEARSIVTFCETELGESLQ